MVRSAGRWQDLYAHDDRGIAAGPSTWNVALRPGVHRQLPAQMTARCPAAGELAAMAVARYGAADEAGPPVDRHRRRW